jgi:hypothetical protein
MKSMELSGRRKTGGSKVHTKLYIHEVLVKVPFSLISASIRVHSLEVSSPG